METSWDLVSLAALLLRLELGIIFMLHGRPKLGPGHQETVGLMRSKGFPMPEVATRFAGLLEVVGGAMLVVGLFTRVFAAAIAIEMLVATWMISHKGFVRGSDWPFTLATALAALALLGSGAYSLEALLFP